MKTIQSMFLLGLALLGMAFPASAQRALVFNQMTPTNQLAVSATQTANLGGYLPANADTLVSIWAKWAVNIGGTFHTTDTASITLTFVRTADGVNDETTPKLTWAIPLNGTNAVMAHTNWTIGACKGIKLLSAQNGSGTNIVTNLVIYATQVRRD